MKLRLSFNRPIGTGLVSLAAGLTREAAEQLAEAAADPVESVHAARVALKRARSVLRLLEKAGAAWAIMPRYRLAELGSRMSAAREAAVTTGLAERFSRRLPGRERVVARLLIAPAGPLPALEAGHLHAALLLEASQLAGAPAPAVSPPQLRGLLRRSLVRTLRRYYTAVTKPTLESVHEWRKAVIVLRDQTALAAARWPQGAGLAHPLLVRFARQLGRRGDLALMARRLQERRVPPELAAARQRLVARWETQRELATLTAMHRWLWLESRLTRLLSERNRPRRATGLGTMG